MDDQRLVRALLTDRPVAFHPMIAKTFGGVAAGLFLSQLLYWSNKGQDPDGWIYKTQAEWEAETGLTRWEQETARKRLKTAGVLEEDYRRLEHRLYYRVSWPVTTELLQLSGMWQNHIPECGVSTFANDGLPHSIKGTEITTETTTEITNTYSGGLPEIADNQVWPDWYSTLYAIPGFTTSLEAAGAWLERSGISLQLAETTAYALKSKWPGNPKRPYRDPWATFQNWVKQPPLAGGIKTMNGEDRVAKFERDVEALQARRRAAAASQ